MDASNDGSESVDQFLARIASLTSKQGEEEAERSRKMEEEMMQARKERQARRAERARSLSPSKTGPTPTLRSVGDTTPVQNRGIDPPVVLTPQSRPQTLGRSGSISPRADRPSLASVDFNRPLPPHPPLADTSPSLGSANNAPSLSRSGTLSWNQRPLSRTGAIGSVRSRPQSVASIPDSYLARPPSPSKDAPEMSRQDIAASLGARDPSWFRQTSDRGLNSAAYRKNDTDSESTTPSFGRGMRLPGMAKEDLPTPGRNIQANNLPTTTTSPPSIPSDVLSQSHHNSGADRPANPRPLSTVTLTPSKSPALDQPYLRSLDLPSPADSDAPGIGRTSSVLSSTSRPSSPTKGLGGFVQSAMMKRSDSVNKRWSVQAGAGLKRGDSVATSRPAHLPSLNGFNPGHARGSSRDARSFKDGESSPLSTSRPVSSHGADPVPILKTNMPRVDDSASAAKDNPLSEHHVPEAVTSPPQAQKPTSTQPSSEDLLSRSPSKTLDPRRWSPTKASWLESALQKPDAPRFTKKPEIPAWKLDMQRSKEQRVKSPELGQSTDSKTLDSPPAGDNSSLGHSDRHSKPFASPAPDPNQPAGKLPLGSGNPDSTQMTASARIDEKPTVPSKRTMIPKDISFGEEKPKPNSSSLVQGNEAASSPRPTERTPVKTEATSTILKSKPQTPPKTDFRAALKARQPASNDNNGTEPEFKAVFGKLKRTQTQNYVAPDLLKDNIAKGKAALSVTGGPQQSKRVDEFKESILQKKEAMKAAGGSTSKRPDSMEISKPNQDQVPEALMRRNALQKTGSLPDTDSRKLPDVLNESPRPLATKIDKPPKPPIVFQKDSLPMGNSSWKVSQSPVASPSKAAPPPFLAPKPLPKEKSLSEPIPSTYGQKVPPSNAPEKEDRDQVTLPVSGVTRQVQADATPKPSASEKSKLAARLNPSLAGMLSRSGSPRLPGEPPSQGIQYSSQSTGRTSSTTPDQPSAELTHMTKGRAKGPKRRTPKDNPSGRNSKPKASSIEPSPKSEDAANSASPISKQANKPAILPPGSISAKPTPRKPSASIEVAKAPSSPPASTTTPKKPGPSSGLSGNPIESAKRAIPAPVSTAELSSKSKPIVAKKSEELRKVSNSDIPESTNTILPKPATPKKFSVLSDQQSRLDAQGKGSLVAKAPLGAASMPLTPNKSKLNTPKSKPETETGAKPGIASSGKANGLGLRLDSSSQTKSVATSELTPPPESELAESRSKPSANKWSNKPPQSEPTATLVRTQLEAILGPLPGSTDRADFDTHSILSSQAPVEKVKTINHQIWEVGAGGKKIPMPPQQEHILFEDSMYLSVHVMQISNGSQTSEAYLWCGDEVSEAAIEDAQLFCRKAARENNAKLEIIRQGKEKSEFFQGLGGIVIIRRNKTSALYMLCGRRHLGHIAFDEVDFTPDQLTSGLPFLISAKFGKLYLWKGASSNPEDVGCARLIGMDLGLTGEIDEISEGEEPPSFWESFPYTSGKRKTTHERSESDRHRGQATRLYRVELDRPKSSGGFWGLRAASPSKPSNKALIEEVRPSTQQDLDASCVQILDVYSELYVIVGQSARKPVEFITALHVAQEMAVLSPSVQDRPLLPSCHVVSGDMPDNVKTAFRKWKQARSTPPRGNISARAEDVMRELGIVS